MTTKLHTIASAGLATLASRTGGQPVDNPDLEKARAQMRSDIAAEVRLREQATQEREAAMLEREQAEARRDELATQHEDLTRAHAEAQARAEELTGTMETQRKDIEDLTRMVQEMTAAQTEASAQLTESFATIERERASVATLREQLQTTTQGHKEVMSRMDRLAASLKAPGPLPPIEAPEYEFIVAARDANGRAAKYLATPVKKS